MAGIGFQLKKLFDQGTLGKVQGAIYSVIISTGPWLITIITIASVSSLAREILSEKETMVFKAMISYSFAYSLIIFGIIEMPITRYLADQHYKNDASSYPNVYCVLNIFVLLVSGISGYWFYAYFDFPPISKIIMTSFLYFVFAVWTSMVFLSAAKHYMQIVFGFIIGGVGSVAAGYFLGPLYGTVGYMTALAIGQAVIAIWLSAAIFIEFGLPRHVRFDFIPYFFKYWHLVLTGFFYYLGIWIDKTVFWLGDSGEQVSALFYTNQYYDTAIFIAYLSIIPTLTIFLVKIETTFFVKYTQYFAIIQNKSPLPVLHSSINDMIDSLKSNLAIILKWQTFISLLALYFATDILDFLRLPSMMLVIYRYGIIGAYLQVLFLTSNIVLMYFDARKEVMTVAIVFFCSQLFFSILTRELGYAYHGLGYVIASLITLLFSVSFLNKRLGHINYYTFMTQPFKNDEDDILEQPDLEEETA